jgi:hypothetical protein
MPSSYTAKKLLTSGFCVGKVTTPSTSLQEPTVKITLDREEVQRILVEYLNSLMPNGNFNACELKCSSYSYFQSADIFREEKPE